MSAPLLLPRADRRPAPRHRRRRYRAVGTGVQAAVILLWCFLPVYWLLAASVRPAGEVYSVTPVPTLVTLQNYAVAFAPANLLLRGLADSAAIATVVTLVVLIVGTSAAYAFGRFRFRGSGVASGAVLAITLLPSVILVTPMFVIVTRLHWSGTLQAVIVPDIALALPLAVYTLGSFLRDLPWELEEAALVDGCTRFQAFVRIMGPLCAPSVVTVAILTFVGTWNEYLVASALTTQSSITATVVVANFSAELTGAASTMAAGTVVTLPVIVLVLLLQRRIIAGLTAGAVRG